jgi:hypothetical protein
MSALADALGLPGNVRDFSLHVPLDGAVEVEATFVVMTTRDADCTTRADLGWKATAMEEVIEKIRKRYVLVEKEAENA